MSSFPILYAAGSITRYHTAPIRAQTLAEHSWGVAMIADAISDEYVSARFLLLAALHHDLAEKATGDVPAHVKWENPTLDIALEVIEKVFQRQHGYQRIFDVLTQHEVDLLKWADTFELCLYCDAQFRQGNFEAAAIRDRGLVHIRENLGFPTPQAKELFNEFFPTRPESSGAVPFGRGGGVAPVSYGGSHSENEHDGQ